jgi:hypothetical protein
VCRPWARSSAADPLGIPAGLVQNSSRGSSNGAMERGKLTEFWPLCRGTPHPCETLQDIVEGANSTRPPLGAWPPVSLRERGGLAWQPPLTGICRCGKFPHLSASPYSESQLTLFMMVPVATQSDRHADPPVHYSASHTLRFPKRSQPLGGTV